MRTLGTSGYLLLLLLITAALVGLRRSRDAAAPPASFNFAPTSGDATPERAPPLAFEREAVDLGVLAVGEPRSVALCWRRFGPGELRVRGVRTGCGCVVAGGLPDVLAEGATGVLTVSLAGRSLPGPFTHVVHVLTDRPPDDLVRLVVTGFVGPDVVVTPATFPLGTLAPGAVADRVVNVRPPPGAAAGKVSATFVGIEGDFEVVDPAEGGARGRDVALTLAAPFEPGPFEGLVEIRVGEAGLWRIPVRGEVATAVRPRAPEVHSR